MMTADFEFNRGLVKLNFLMAQYEVSVRKQKGYKHFIRSFPFDRNMQYLKMSRAILEYCKSQDLPKVDNRLVSLKEARTILGCSFLSVEEGSSL